MLFSQKFRIVISGNENWFDPFLETDTELFIDPMLVFQNEISEFKDSKKKIQDFFQKAFEKVALAKGRLGRERDEALNMLSFKEPNEILLGYTAYGSGGSGLSKGFAKEIFDAMVDFLDWGIEDFGKYPSTFEMFVEGIGPDRISDMIANIIKEDLLKYTVAICEKNGVPRKTFAINNLGYDEILGWIRGKVKLPQNPFDAKPILLIPKDFLRTDSYLDILDFEEYLLHIENPELRRQATRLFTGNLDRKKLREAIERDPQTVREIINAYILKREQEKATPYDLKNDPNLIYFFKELVERVLRELPTQEVTEKTKTSLKEFVEKVIEQFKGVIEKRENYRLLFNDDGSTRGERASRILFWGIADTMCKGINGKINLSSEGQTGRGPVDFKFSEGYLKKILVEIKLAKSGALYSGMESQLTTYLESDETDIGYYVVIKLLGADNTKVIRLKDRHKKLKLEKGKEIIIKDIDSYFETKISASKVFTKTK